MRNLGIEYLAPGQMRLYNLGPPGAIGPPEVLIRTHYSGITNGTERHALLAEHGWTHFPGRHGYQHVGRIEAQGNAVSSFQVGDEVFFGRYVGHRGWHVVDVAGMEAHANGSHLCVKLPGDVPPPLGSLLGVAGVAMRGIRRCRVGPAQNVWVAGAGLIGQFAAQSARVVGAHVTVTDLHAGRLSLAQELGAHRVLNVHAASTPGALQEGGPYDVIIDACGAEALLQEIHQDGLLAHGGVIGALAVRSETVFPWSMLHGREASIEVSCHFSRDDLRVVLHFVRQGLIGIEPLISHRLSIDHAPTIYDTLRDRPGELLGVVFDWIDPPQP